jgi:type I restriction enzyme, S subunit
VIAISTRALGEFVQIRTGKLDANASSEDGEYPFFTCAKEPLRISTFSYDCDCVLVAGNGDLNVKHYHGKFDAYQRTYIVEPLNPSALNSRFLFHFLDKYVEKLRHLSIGGVIKYIKIGNLTEAPLPVLPIDEQRRIATILDQAETLRTQRRQALAHLDTLTQSLFLDMFGDALANTNRIPMGALVDEFRYGTSEKSGASGFPALRIPNVASGRLDLNELKTVAVETAEFERLRLLSGDLLFVRTNGNPDYVGRCAVFEPALVANTSFEPTEFIYASYLIRARLKGNDLLPLVLQQYLSEGEGRRALRARCKTSAGQYNINTEGLGAIPVPLFPLALQQTFATRIQAIEALKATHHTALAQLDALFASLQQRAFAGEL